jgi:hypothetical protein
VKQRYRQISRASCRHPLSLFLPEFMKTRLTSTLLALVATASAQIGAGGGKSAVGTMTNHASIGGIVASAPQPLGSLTLRSGLIEILYAAAQPLDPDADANSNGLPDSWEEEHFPGQTLDPEADPDGDGTTNRMEYLAGTNPRDRSSFFRPVGSMSGSVFTLPIPTVAGRSYKVWATRDLASWHLRQALTGDGTVKNFTFDESAITSGPLHAPGQSAKCFFRVEILLP